MQAALLRAVAGLEVFLLDGHKCRHIQKEFQCQLRRLNQAVRAAGKSNGSACLLILCVALGGCWCWNNLAIPLWSSTRLSDTSLLAWPRTGKSGRLLSSHRELIKNFCLGSMYLLYLCYAYSHGPETPSSTPPPPHPPSCQLALSSLKLNPRPLTQNPKP